jgi:dienelactone hydrolase
MVTTRDIPYEADGRSMVGRLGLPEGDDRRPGVLIAHEGNGLDDYQKGRAERFADLGYVALALDYYGGGVPLGSRDEINERLGGLMVDTDRTRSIASAALEVLLAEPRVDPSRVAAVGYCFGGTMVLELARTGADLKAVVALHPGLVSNRPEDAVRIVGRVLVGLGAEDPIVTTEQRLAFEEEMRAAGVDWQLHLYGGTKHSFTNPHAADAGLDALAYDPLADRRSWRAMLDLFDEVLA